MIVYDITLTVTESDTFQTLRSKGVSGASLFEVIHKIQLELLIELKKEYEEEMDRIKKQLVPDDIPF